VVPGGPAWFHPGRVGTLQIGPQTVLGHFGELHPKTLDALGAEGPLVAFEVTVERIPEPKRKGSRTRPALVLSPFQPVTRDFAFLVDRAVRAGDIVRAVQSAERRLIADVRVFDVYAGAGVPPEQKSIAIAVTLQPRDKTLTETEIDAVSSRLVAEVTKRTGGVLRT
jgi:phenylalanyl-tRNA synthetase beta chain